MKIILPKRHVDTIDSAMPLFFLAGPIRGGGNWQADMCREIERQSNGRATIACPCRWTEGHELATHFVGEVDENLYPRQLDWERVWLTEAGEGFQTPSCIIFWLPSESEKFPHPGPEPYAMDTRGELGEWRYRMRANGARVVVGGDSTFFGLSQIQRNFSAVLEKEFPVYGTMSETVAAARRVAHNT